MRVLRHETLECPNCDHTWKAYTIFDGVGKGFIHFAFGDCEGQENR